MARGRTERAKSKAETAGALAGLGAGIGAVGGPVGAAIGGGIGAITGLIIGDQTTVFPTDMIAIPAFEAYLLSHPPSFMIYIKEGEVLTQVVPTDAQIARDVIPEEVMVASPGANRKRTAYERKYKAAFKQVKGRYMKKDGKWKKDGFKAAVKAAHRAARGGK